MPVGERGLLEPSELWPQEQQLCAKAAEGGLLDLRCRRPGEDDPVRGREWGADRQIRAQVVFQLLTGQGPVLASSVVAVRLRGAQIVGRLNLGGYVLRCPLELNQCHLRHRLDLAKAEASNITLRGSYLRRLSARRLRVTHTLNLSNGFCCDGGVDLRSAHISGQLNCFKAVLANKHGEALTAHGLTVGGNMFMSNTTTVGLLDLLGAHIGGQLNCEECTFVNLGGPALLADGLRVAGSMFLTGTKVAGETRLLRACIGGELNCDGATFANLKKPALTADGLDVGSDMFLRRAEVVAGEIRLLGAHIAGQLSCIGATFSGEQDKGLYAERLSVDGDIFMRNLSATVALHFIGARIGGQLDCTEASLINAEGLALDLERATVAHEVLMHPTSLKGGLDLTRARVGAWDDEKRTWPEWLSADGFVYEAISAPDAAAQDRLHHWLRSSSNGGFAPQPYEQLARVYRQEGNEEAARTIAIGKQQARRAGVRGWAQWPSRAWSAVLRWTIGYGYRPVRALVPLVVLTVVGWWLFDLASHNPSLLHPAKTGPEQPAFHSFRYTLDLLLPVVNFKQRDAFVTGGWAAWAAFGFTFAGWLLAAIVVAGLTGVFKRD